MDLSSLVPSLPAKKGAAYTLDRGKIVQHPHAALFDKVKCAEDALRGWGVKSGMRVGIYAPNSYQWLVYDLALIEIGAISVPFTDDFAGAVNDQLLDRYNIALLLTTRSNARLFPDKPAHIAFIDAENEAVRVLDREGFHGPGLKRSAQPGLFFRLRRRPQGAGRQPQRRGDDPAADHGSDRLHSPRPAAALPADVEFPAAQHVLFRAVV